MHIALIAKPGHLDSGIGRYTQELKRALETLGHRATVVHPVVPLPGWLLSAMRRWPGWDLEAFFYNYPIWARYPEAHLYHLTSQNLATLMLFRRPPGKVVVTVHDIIPWLTRKDPLLRTYRHRLEAYFDQLALRGIEKVDGILADSTFTYHVLQNTIDVTDRLIVVTHLGVG